MKAEKAEGMVRGTRFAAVILAWWWAASVTGAPVFAEAQSHVPAAWVGTWTAPQYKVARTADLDVAVWGRNVFATRDVDLSVEPDGDATLKVVESIVDQRGRRKPFATSITEARLQIRAEDAASAAPRPLVLVTSADMRYADDPADRYDRKTLVVKLSLVPGRTDAMNLRFDTPEGRGSFGDTLTRSGSSR